MFARVISKTLPEFHFIRAAGLGICLAVLTGCAASRPLMTLPDISSWELRQDVLRQVDDWGFKGRIAVKTGDEGFNGKFNWTQIGNEFDVKVGGPLGIGTVRIAGDERTIVLTDKDGFKTRLIDPEAELMVRYGWTIPVARLRFWALGIPDPALPADTEFDEAGRLVHLEQSNWIVTISRYRESAGQQMPRTLTASNPDTRVRMVIDKWFFY
mgnify:CR=1 FL=1|jgi:outer membrane lipoprotein LolB